MKEITIAPGVKIVFEEDCDECKQYQENAARLLADNIYFEWLPEEKSGDNVFSKGFNNALAIIKKYREDRK